MIRRLTQTGQEFHSIFGPDGNRIAEYEWDSVAQTSTLLREYIWLDGLLVAMIENGYISYIRTDHIGRPVMATDAYDGSVLWSVSYLPFGKLIADEAFTLRFPGQWYQDESGLFQNWMRDYDPTTGRYMQADPLGLVDGASVYGYARQNPGRYTDPRGEDSTDGGISFPPLIPPFPSPKTTKKAWEELLDFSHNYNPIDLLIQGIVEMCTTSGRNCKLVNEVFWVDPSDGPIHVCYYECDDGTRPVVEVPVTQACPKL